MENVLVQHIEQTPGVVGGKPRIAGHRVRVMDIAFWHEKRGLTPDEIVDLFPGLTLADVHAALAYYFDHRAEIESAFEREAALSAELKARYPSKLQARLRD
ncbi:MAG: DUF433 domain-containing protein [Anaerolineales bacterium]|nr:DUF433 domain-containing protein [Anaerolineales bacterium]